MRNQSLKLNEIIFIAVLATAMGIIWWGYSFFYDIVSPFLKIIGLQNLLDGPWYMGGVFFAYIVRKPGSAILGETLAACVEAMISQWGFSAIVSGVFQGLPVEILFILCRYKIWNKPVMLLAGALAACGGYLVSFYYEQYWILSLKFNLLNLACDVVSGAILAGLLSKYLADRLAISGVLNQYKISGTV